MYIRHHHHHQMACSSDGHMSTVACGAGDERLAAFAETRPGQGSGRFPATLVPLRCCSVAAGWLALEEVEAHALGGGGFVRLGLSSSSSPSPLGWMCEKAGSASSGGRSGAGNERFDAATTADTLLSGDVSTSRLKMISTIDAVKIETTVNIVEKEMKPDQSESQISQVPGQQRPVAGLSSNLTLTLPTRVDAMPIRSRPQRTQWAQKTTSTSLTPPVLFARFITPTSEGHKTYV
ncbi:hypothetical protein IWZ01DRAFT_160355 [Phyllosticta capitalensis]